MWIENSQLCLINAAHEHYITQTGKKSKTAAKNFMGLGSQETNNQGLEYGAKDWGQEKQVPIKNKIFILIL